VPYRPVAILSFALMKNLTLCVLLLSATFATDQMSHTCRFARGPLQGQTHTLLNRSATAVGSTCSDGLTSSGIGVPDPDTPETSQPMSHTCKFNVGPLQGQTHTLPNRSATRVVRPVPMGSPAPEWRSPTRMAKHLRDDIRQRESISSDHPRRVSGGI
jgi:hypothetical protein